MSCPICTDDPFANFSAEDPDSDRIRSRISLVGKPPLGWEYSQTGCLAVCYSDVSQQDADDCALAQAQICLWHDWVPPCPVPPCVPTIFLNEAQTCTATCPNGGTFSYTVPAGTVQALTQAEANSLAFGLACLRSRLTRPCIANDPPDGCVGTPYDFTIIGAGGDPPYTFRISGAMLPDGLTMNSAGRIQGTPTTPGSSMFQVEMTDEAGTIVLTTFTVCIVEIENPNELPAGFINTEYFEPLIQEGAETESWVKTSGSLPPGLTLSSAGLISGTPTTPGVYTFTVRLTHTCA